MKANHKYRTTIYLGKDIYAELEKMSKQLNISVSSLATLMFKTGWEMSKLIDKQDEMDNITKGVLNNGK